MVATESGFTYTLSDLKGSDPHPEVHLPTIGADVIYASPNEEEPRQPSLNNVINDNQYDALLSSVKDEPLMFTSDFQSLFCIPPMDHGFIRESIHTS